MHSDPQISFHERALPFSSSRGAMIHRVSTDHLIRGEASDKTQWGSLASGSESHLTHSAIREEKKKYDQNNIAFDCWRSRSAYSRLRKYWGWRLNGTVCRRSEGLRPVVGNLAVDSRSGKRKAGARKCFAKYDPDYRSQYLPVSKGQRHRHASSWDIHCESQYQAQTSGLDRSRRTARRSTDARHLRDLRSDSQACLLGSVRWATADAI